MSHQDLGAFQADRDAQPGTARPKRVCFFFNAQIHQLLHAVPIAIELSRDPGFAVTIMAPAHAHLAHARTLAEAGGSGPIRFEKIGGRFLDMTARMTGATIPPKLLTLAIARAQLGGYDAIVLPERTSLLLRRMGLRSPRYIHTTHGAGDRAIGFEKRIREFDFVLIAGEKQRRRMLEKRVIREGGYAVVGYPKFDAVALAAASRPRLFANDRPIVLYNPHCCSDLSSWKRFGETVLQRFAADPRYNLILAPHIKLFEARGARHRAERALARFAGLPNIHIDLGSARSIDMTYTAMADVYLGDVSSQIYEFLSRPKPCLFLDAHHARWHGNPDYAHWRYGRVVRDAGDIVGEVDTAIASHPRYLPVQREGLRATFDIGAERSSVRAARALGRFLAAPAAAPAPVMLPLSIQRDAHLIHA